MSGYVEVMVQGNCRAFISAGQIAGILSPPGADGQTVATPDTPLALIMNSGETLQGVYGISPNRLILNTEGVKALARKSGRIVMVAYLDSQEAFEAELQALFALGGDDA